MKHIKLITVVCLILIIWMDKGMAQKVLELKQGKSISKELKPGEKHHYILKLNKDQFAFFKLMQKGVDALITTYDPKNEKIQDFDSPNGKNGPEYFKIISAVKGDYRIEVQPLDKEQTEGNYDLHIVKIEPKAKELSQQVDQLFTLWDNNESPGAAVSIVKDGKVIYKKGFGMANLENDIPITPSTIFHIASVSKQFTDFSILLLALDGKLSLDDDVRKYIPDVPDFGKTITLKHLAHHTSGIRDQWNLLAMAGWRLDDVITKEQILKLISNQKELNYEPGAEFLYCNTGYTLLAEVVERVSGKSFAEFTSERIFKPLGMMNTLFYDDHEKIVKNRAYSYYTKGNEIKKSVLSYSTVGATSLFTTVEDLAKWALNFEYPKVGNKELIDQMNKRAILNKGDTISYALGQGIGEYKGLKLIGHGGADAGYRTYLGRFPDQKFSVIVLSNLTSFDPGGLAMKIADIYLKDQIKPVEKKKDKTESVMVSLDTLNLYIGEFEIQPGFIMEMTVDNNNLFVQATGQVKFALKAISSKEFEVQGVEAKLEFVHNDSGKVDLVKLYQGGQTIEAPRTKPFDKKSMNLQDFTGSFYSDELKTTYDFIIRNDTLIAKHQRHSDIVLNPVKKDRFSGNVWFFGQIEFVRDENKNITGCKVSNGRVRNLWFRKI